METTAETTIVKQRSSTVPLASLKSVSNLRITAKIAKSRNYSFRCSVALLYVQFSTDLKPQILLYTMYILKGNCINCKTVLNN